MSRILVTGGRGVFGREVVARLKGRGHTVRIMSRKAARGDSGVEWAQGDMETGAGLAEAVRGVDIIVNSASHPFKAQQVDVIGTGKLMDAARAANVGHVVHISIVGIDKIPFAYYQAKVGAEEAVKKGGIGWSILRATQFHTLPGLFLQPMKRYFWSPMLALHPDTPFQLIDPGEVADYLLPYITAEPGGYLPEVGGPELVPVREIVRSWLDAEQLRRPTLYLPLMPKVREAFRAGYHTCPDRRYGKITWADYLRRTYPAQPREANSYPHPPTPSPLRREGEKNE